jgi:hypothetical protein
MVMRTVFRRIVFGGIIAALVLLLLTFTLPFFYNGSAIIEQTALQSMRAQRMAKDALIMTYRPVIEHAQALSEIQNTLPLWENEQAVLNATVGLDSRPLFTQTQPDFTSMDTALTVIVAHAQAPIDRIQVQIVLDHEQEYTQTMNQLSVLRQQHIQQSNIVASWVQIVLAVLVLAAILALHFSVKEEKTYG